MRRITKHPLLPVPKVYVPASAGVIALVSDVVATGVLDRTKAAALVVVVGYALIGWATPTGRTRGK